MVKINKLLSKTNVFATFKIQQAGKIRGYGMSTKTIAGGKLTVDHADIAMVAFNPEYTEERVVIHHAQQKQKSIFVKKAFASGHLQTFTQALDFIFTEPGVTSVIIGTINAEHFARQLCWL